MSPNSRPPLTTRIRASFDGKRSKSEVISSTQNGFPLATQDPDALRQAIDQAINTETFQNAIAANLAKLLKPSIKSALDTIQPVVEAVYNHELLLRKTNKSVENILGHLDPVTEAHEDNDLEDPSADPSAPVNPRKRSIIALSSSGDVEGVKQLLAENNARNDAKLAELSGVLESNGSKIAEIVEGIAGMNAALYPARDALDFLTGCSDHSKTTISVMQAQLDQLSADVWTIVESIGSDLASHVKSINQQPAAPDTSLLSAHTMKLDAISTDLAALEAQTDTVEALKNISTKLEALKENVQAGIASSNENFASLQPQVGNILASVEAHSSKLDEKNNGGAIAEILAALQKSNDAYAAHTIAPGGLKERGTTSESESPPTSSQETMVALQALANDIASLKENIQAGLATNHDNVFGVSTQVDDVLTVLAAHRAADPSSEILAAVQKSNEPHASHAEALEGIRSTNVASVPSGERTSVTNLEPHIASIIATLNAHTTTLDDIKAAGVPTGADIPTTAGASDDEGPGHNMTAIISTLESQTGILNDIKKDVSAEILTILQNINEGHASQNIILSEIRESDMSDEILTALHASNDSHVNHAAVLADLHTAVKASNDSHASHAGVLDEIMSARTIESVPGSQAATSFGGLDTQIGAIITTLEEQNTSLSFIKDASIASIESSTAHTSALAEIKDAIAASNEAHNSHSIVLGDLKYAAVATAGSLDAHAADLSEIKDLMSASDASQKSHIASFDEIKKAVGVTSVSHASHSADLAELKDLRNSHAASLEDIKEAIAATTDSHASHSADLAEIKDASKAANDLHASHITALTELKATQPTGTAPAAESCNELTDLGTHIQTIITTLESQNSTLSDIKEATTSPEVLAAVQESHELLTSHTPLLDSIKDSQIHEDILANIASLKVIVEESRSGRDEHGVTVKGLHEMTKNSNSELAQAIGALALGGVGGSGAGALSSKDYGSSAELLEEVKAVRAIVEKSSTSIETLRETTTSMASQIDINHTTVITSVTTLSDEVKAEMDASGTEVTSSIAALSGDVKAIELSSLSAAIEAHGKEINGLNISIEGLDGSVNSNRSHIVGLVDGVHLNKKGLDQLKEHVLLHNVGSNPPMPRPEISKADNSPVLENQEDARPLDDAHAPEPGNFKELETVAKSESMPPAEHDSIPTIQEPESELEKHHDDKGITEDELTAHKEQLIIIEHEPAPVEETPSAVEEHTHTPDAPAPIEDVSYLQLDEDEKLAPSLVTEAEEPRFHPEHEEEQEESAPLEEPQPSPASVTESSPSLPEAEDESALDTEGASASTSAIVSPQSSP